MGNRAYVVFENGEDRSPAIYLHWNGGPESIYAFLHALKGYTADQHSPGYSCARFVQLAGNTLGGTLSLGLICFRKYEDLICDDNGLYVVTPTSVRRMIDDSPDPRHPHLRWLADEEVGAEREEALNHRYWLPTEGQTSFLDDIRLANNPHFLPSTA